MRFLYFIHINCHHNFLILIEIFVFICYTDDISNKGADDLCVIQLQAEILM